MDNKHRGENIMVKKNNRTFDNHINNCKKTETFTNHQKNLKERYNKKYGNTKLRTLKLKLTVLKHNLYATSVQFKCQKKRCN